MRYRELVLETEKRLEKSDVSENTAKLFLYELLSERDINMYVVYEEEADPEILKRYEAGIQRLLNNEPLAYILGYQWFYGRRFKVHKDVFIPRFETEELCANLLSIVDDYFSENNPVVADVACGSGAIGITLKAEEPRLQVYATDLSEEAVSTAKDTASSNSIDVRFLQGDLLEPLKERNIRLDILACNPPYIVEDAALDPSVVDYEPHMALFGGEDGLDFYRRLLKEANEVIKEKAVIAFEIGYDQKDALLKLGNEYFPNDFCEVLKDMNGKDRMFFLYHNIEVL